MPRSPALKNPDPAQLSDKLSRLTVMALNSQNQKPVSAGKEPQKRLQDSEESTLPCKLDELDLIPGPT